jgi:2-C-methyl-D-erythritol 4-phosphate cytidylyltransferase
VDKYGIKKVSAVVTGGAERYLSVYEGLKAIKKADNETYVLIHDGARPFISGKVIKAAIEKVKETGACIVAVPSKDTVKIGNIDNMVESTPDRRNVWLVQTPQAFEYENIFEAYKKAIASGRDDITDDSMVMESFGEKKIHFVEGDYDNIKLTTPEDLTHGIAILRAKTDLEKNI